MKKLLLLLVLLVPIQLYAQEFTYQGIKYKVLDAEAKTCQATGCTEECPNELIFPEIAYNGDDAYTLISIGGGSFYENTRIHSIEIPNTVNSVEGGTFSGWSSLKTVVIQDGESTIHFLGKVFPWSPISKFYLGRNWTTIDEPISYSLTSTTCSVELGPNVTRLPDYALSGLFQLTEIKIPDSVVSIGKGAFGGCNLKSIELPPFLEAIEEGTFSNCENLESVTFSSALVSIGKWAFWGCNLKSIELPPFLESIEEGTFSNCVNLESVTFPSALVSIGKSAFDHCGRLINLTLPNSIVEIGDYAFNYCPITAIELPPNLVSLGAGAFSKCPITAIEFPQSLQTIEASAFSGCKLTDIIIPPTVQTIGESAFAGNQIPNLTLPKTLKSIGAGAFANNPIEKLTVNCNVDISNLITFNSLKELIYGDDAAIVPALSIAPNLEKVILPTNLTSLVNNAFADCRKLKGLELPPSLKTIGQNAFNGCASLDELVLPSTVSSIGSFAFANCSSLKTLKIPEGVKTIDESLFENCTSLEKVSVPSTVSYFGTNVFKNCSNLRSVIVPNGVENIPPFMMQGCSSVNEILLPNSVKTIGDRAFTGCTDLMNVNIGTGIYEIADYAFENCPNIKNIHCMGLNPPYAERYTFPTSIYNNAVVTVQEQSLQRYNNADPWYRFLNYMTVSGAVSLSHYNVDMAGNEVFQLGVYGANNKIVWTSSNPSVAYANECGLIVAMGITGSTTITAHVDGEEINCRVTVSAIKRDLKGKRLANEDEELIEPVDMIIESISGNPPMVNVRLIPIGSCTVIDWTSSDESIASVENGIVTVHEDGDVEFGAETENGLGENLEVNTDDIGETGVFEIFDDITVENTNVYDFTGRCLIIKASEQQIKHLNKGLYIINGKKVLIK